MSDGVLTTVLIGSPIILYAAVRIVGAAWFKSKQQFDSKKGSNHGTQTQR